MGYHLGNQGQNQLHGGPFETESSDVLSSTFRIRSVLLRIDTSNQISFLYASTQTPSTNYVKEVDFIIPVEPKSKKVAVESEGIAWITRVLASKADARRHEIPF